MRMNDTQNRSSAALHDTEAKLSQQTRILESMLDLGRAVAGELDLDSLCDLIVDKLSNTFDAEAVTLFFRDDETGDLNIKSRSLAEVSCADDATPHHAARAALLSERVVRGEGDATQNGRSAPAESHRVSLVAVPLKADNSDSARPENATAAVPLKAENKIKGVITITWPVAAQRPNDDDLHLLDVLAGQIAPAIDNAWLYGQLKELNAGLEQKIVERTRALADSNEQLTRTIDELKQAQAQLVQSEKMASLGQLTAGVAHEINNPLAFAISNTAIARERLIRARTLWRLLSAYADGVGAADHHERHRALTGFIETLRKDPAYRDDVLAFEADLAGLSISEQGELGLEFLRYVRAREEQSGDLEHLAEGLCSLLDKSREGLERVKGIVLDLRSFSRLDEAQFQNADIDAGIASTLSIVAHLAKDRGVSLSQERGLSRTYPCFSAKLNQVVLNLATNALQATPEGGAVKIRTWEDLAGIYIDVSDTGAGIATEHLTRIFDPFFTTKPVGQGTGLGLSISYKIIEEHRGTIRVSSRVGKGSCFTICLPPRSE